MVEKEIQRDMLNQVIKKTITRIKALQVQLKEEIQERTALGKYEDCGSFYIEQVIRTESAISELIQQKISLEKWRKKLQFET